MILFEGQSMMTRKSLAMLSSKYENKVIDSNMLGKGITYDGAPEHREYTTGSSTPHGSTGICIP